MPKKLIEKPYNAGTMSVSAFWSMIRSALRQKSRWWRPIIQAKHKARRKYVGPNKRQKYEYKCAQCKKWHMEKNIEVDHLMPCGSLRSGDDLKGFVERLFCEVENLIVLCRPCHKKKTEKERKK